MMALKNGIKESEQKPINKRLIVIIVILFLVGFFSIYFGVYKKSGTNETTDNATLTTVDEKDYESHSGSHKLGKGIKECKAYSSWDVSACDKINDSVGGLGCNNRLYIRLAYKNKNDSFCNYLDDSLGKVYEDRLPGQEGFSDIEVCKLIVEHISNGKVDEFCEEWAEKTTGQLSSMPREDLLLFCKGTLTFDEYQCEKIPEISLREECNLLIGNC